MFFYVFFCGVCLRTAGDAVCIPGLPVGTAIEGIGALIGFKAGTRPARLERACTVSRITSML